MSQVLFFSSIFFLLSLTEHLQCLYRCLRVPPCYNNQSPATEVLPWAYTKMFNDNPSFTIPSIFARFYFCERFPRSLLKSLCASQLGVCPVFPGILQVGIKQTGSSYSQIVEPCSSLWIILVPIHYFPNYHMSWHIQVFSSVFIFEKRSICCFIADKFCAF